jgi:hypothetical protein
MDKYIHLNPDDQAYCIKELEQLRDSVGFMFQMLQQNELTEDFKNTVFSGGEYMIKNISEKFNYNGKVSEMVDKRSKPVRQKNERIREIELQLATGTSFENFNKNVREIFDNIIKFWELEGFSGSYNYHMDSYGCLCIELSATAGYGDTLFDFKDEKPKRVQIDDFSDFRLSQNETNILLDCDYNRKKINKILLKKFPSLKIQEWKNKNYDGECVITNINCVLYNINDVMPKRRKK